jgi:hypothetical protein
MPPISFDLVLTHRAVTYRLNPGLHIGSKEQAIDYVNERGFVFFWPIKDAFLPSLWTAVAGDRPVADEHDDPGHVTWGWKDELLGSRVWHYAKVLRKKASFISLANLPYFYALSENYGEPEKDYLEQYREGRLPHETKIIYETLIEKGPLDTLALRKAAHMTNKTSDTHFTRAMDSLQADLKIMPVGIAPVGAWKYAMIYECVHRFYPDLIEQAHHIRQSVARAHLAELYFKTVGAATGRHVEFLFGWSKAEAAAALDALVQASLLRPDIEFDSQRGGWYALAALL